MKRSSKQNNKTNLPFIIGVFITRHEPHAHELQIRFGQGSGNKNTINLYSTLSS